MGGPTVVSFERHYEEEEVIVAISGSEILETARAELHSVLIVVKHPFCKPLLANLATA